MQTYNQPDKGKPKPKPKPALDPDTSPPGPDPAFGKVWCFSHRDGWREIPDPLPPDSCGLDEQLAEAGYDVFIEHGDDTATLRLAAYARNQDDTYIVVLTGVMVYRLFAVADGPSMLALLPGLVAAARDSAVLDEMEREREERAKERERERGEWVRVGPRRAMSR